MKDSHLKEKGKRPPVHEKAEVITCTHCGSEMPLWAEVEVTRCLVCGHRFFKREATLH